jgi:hypothetical protein
MKKATLSSILLSQTSIQMALGDVNFTQTNINLNAGDISVTNGKVCRCSLFSSPPSTKVLIIAFR